MAQAQDITVPVKLDEKTFKRFARFDMLRLRKRWVRPAVFAVILTAFAAAALLSGKKEAGMIASVLLVIGLGLPIVYIGSFLSQVNMQALGQRLGKEGRRVYDIRLKDDEIIVVNRRNTDERVTLPWQEVKQVYWAKGCIYLYVHTARAFLIPDGQASVPPDSVWTFITAHMESGKCKKLC
ncbi:MAG: YcxB family protein [Clostridia bacterium]|nr:YcxB family protein [Clostridia bacterium]